MVDAAAFGDMRREPGLWLSGRVFPVHRENIFPPANCKTAGGELYKQKKFAGMVHSNVFLSLKGLSRINRSL
jgi:hypothetical protein